MSTIRKNIKKIAFLTTALSYLPVTAIANSGELLVQASLSPFIAVTPAISTVNISTSPIGDFGGSFSFLVESNTPNVSVHAIITNLYKDTNPNDTRVKPIDVNTTAGVDLSPLSASASPGSDLNASFTSTTSVNKPSGIFSAHQTEQVNLESTQSGVFNQDIELSVTWTIDETIRPAGVYGGYVQLFVSAIP
ncbi:MAG: hypothetical protein OEX07_02895 [Gammaproteobacteria bacterium]|nr:hypothetical protein [Gammaproteobacteria bacterium]